MAVEVLTTPRPQLVKPRERYIYYPDSAEVPEAAAVNVRRRSYTILADVEITDGTSEGVLFSQGSFFGGHSLFIKDGHLHYVYNWLGEVEQKISSDIPVPAGECLLSASFSKTGDDEQGSALGALTLHINEQKVGQAEIKTQPGKFGLGGEGLNAGRDGGEPVSREYKAPFAFTGGTLKRVIVDVSGEQFVDIEKEAVGMMVRE
jgi:arylsulfatase